MDRSVAWLATWNWGSVADWFTGLLTAGTLFIAVMILVGDRRRSRRAAADSFSTWQVFVGSRAVKGKADYTVELHAYNAGDRPIPSTMVMVRPGSPQHALQTMSVKPIAPQSEVLSEIGFEDVWYDSPLIIYFRDANGRGWLRDIATNKYIGRRQINRWYRKYGTTDLGMYHFLFTARNGELIQKRIKEETERWNAEHPAESGKKHRRTKKSRG